MFLRFPKPAFLVVMAIFSTMGCFSGNGVLEPAMTPPPEDGAPGLPIVKPTLRRHHYPGSNEPNQWRLDADFTESSRLAIDIDPNKLPAPVTLRVMGPVEGYRVQAEGEPAMGDLDGLIARIIKDAKTDREKADALFFFTRDQMKDWYYPAQGLDLTVEDLSVLIWNFGYGFCYDLGRLQAGIWARAGLRSRIVGWPVHTVAEVFYDLQHRSFYLKPDGQVAGFEELKANGDLFYQGLNKYGLDAIGYPPHHMVQWYGIAEPNFQDSNDGDHWKYDKDWGMDLRFGEFFELLYTQPGVMYHPDSWVQYYGEMTLRKSPPWPIQGRLVYAPGYMKQPAIWQETKAPSGEDAFAITMKNPFIFTEGWIKIPGFSKFNRFWIEAFGRTYEAGRLVGGNGLFSKYITGSNEFTIIVAVDKAQGGVTAEDFGLQTAEIHTRLQVSHLGVPRLKPGMNQWPIMFESGRPHVSLWYLDNSADLAITQFRMEPENPKPGEAATLYYAIANKGTLRNQPTKFEVYNNTTVFRSETIEEVGALTIPPIEPGKTYEAAVPWIANTRQTWYGQNPYVQLFDAFIDMPKDRPDPDTVRANNRRQDYVLLKQEDGQLPELPGYRDLPGGH